jgi:hypothetical protein
VGIEHQDYCNCGGTTCTSTTFSSGPRCQHLTGWYVTVEFLWIFKRRIYVCSDCGENLPGDWKVPNIKARGARDD